jgi:hypothetical protein
MFEDQAVNAEEAPSMDDTLSKAFDDISGRDDATDDSGEAEQQAGRARDEFGRFKGNEQPEDAVADDADAVADAEQESETDADAKESLQPPSSWRANVRDQFAALPAEVQEEVLRRESDFHKGIEQYRTDADYGRNLKSVFAPYQQDFASLGVNETQAVSSLLQTERTLRLGTPEQKLAIFQSMASSYGVPVEALVSDDGDVRQTAMLNAQLTSRLNQLEQQLHGFTTAQQSQVQAQVTDSITKFASDPANKWFSDVREDMGRLLEGGIAADLQDAYDKACNMRPDIRAAIAAQQQREADEKRQKEAQQRVIQAKKSASVNVRQSGPKPVASNAPRTIDDTLREVYDRLQAS